jgi:ABC-type polysaccharide/polyol phosphate export permease
MCRSNANPNGSAVEARATVLGKARPFFSKIKHLRAGMPCADVMGRRGTMLFTIAVILLVLWLLGMVSGYTLGNFIYVLLVIALVLFVVGLVSGRRTI